jgi:hypothetical protein
MGEIKRYSVCAARDGALGLAYTYEVEQREGQWVLYVDHERIVRELEDRIAAMMEKSAQDAD